MADNTVLNTGAGGDTIASDDIAGIKYQRVKVDFGADGSATDVSSTNPLPVDGSGVTQPVSGTFWQAAQPVTDNGGNLSIDWAGTVPPIGAGTEAAALRVAIATDSTIQLEASTNNIGDVDVLTIAAGDNNIGNVDIVTLPALVAGTANIGDVDVLTVPAPLSTTGGGTEATALRVTLASDSTGLVSVDDNAGSLTVDQGAAGTAWEQVGDVAHDAVGTSVNPVLVGGYASAAAPTGVSLDGDAVRAWHLLNGAQATVLTAAGALIAGDAANGLDVDVTRLPALVAGTANIGDVDVLTLPALVAGTANIGDVDVLTIAAGDNNIGNVDVLTMPTGATAAAVQGTVAHDGVDAQNPIGVGYRAIAHGANPTAVAAADRTVGYANRAGIPFILGGHPNVVTIELAATGAQTDVAIVTIATGLKIVVTQIQMTADNANTVDVGFRVGFGAVNTPTTTGVVLTHPGVAAGSGISRGDGSGIIGVGADNEDLRVTSEVPTTGSIRILVTYFTVES